MVPFKTTSKIGHALSIGIILLVMLVPKLFGQSTVSLSEDVEKNKAGLTALLPMEEGSIVILRFAPSDDVKITIGVAEVDFEKIKGACYSNKSEFHIQRSGQKIVIQGCKDPNLISWHEQALTANISVVINGNRVAAFNVASDGKIIVEEIGPPAKKGGGGSKPSEKLPSYKSPLSEADGLMQDPGDGKQFEKLQKTLASFDASYTSIKNATELRAKLPRELIPFFDDYLNLSSKSSAIEKSSGIGSVGLSEIIPANDAILAISDFIAERFKEELVVAFFSKFKQFLKDNSTQLQTLLPTTYSMLTTQDPYNYNSFLPLLRKNFEYDVLHSPENLKNFLVLYSSDAAKQNEAYYPILAALDIIALLRDEGSIGNFLDGLGNKSKITYIDKLAPNLKNSLKLIALLSKISKDKYGAYANAKSWESLVSNPIELKLYVGLVLVLHGDALKEIDLDSQNLYEFLTNNIPRIDRLAASAKSVANKVNHITEFLNNKQNSGKDRLSVKDWLEVLRRSTDVVVGCIDEYQTIRNEFGVALPPDEKAKLQTFRSWLMTSQNLIAAIQDEDWAGAVGSIVYLVSSSVKGKVSEELGKYGAFIGSVLTAKNSEDMKNALNAAALPVGSWRIKRENTWDISLNVFAGGNVCFSPDTKFGFTAPIGVSLSIGTGDISFSAFGSIIDVGAVVNQRLTSSDAALPEITWSDVLAPGGGLVFGFPCVPLSLGVLYQNSPRLVSITPSEAVRKEHKPQCYVFLAVDIPIFSFFTSAR